MILASYLLSSLLLQLLFSATAYGYPLHPQNEVIRRSYHTPGYDSLPQLQWRRCMLHEGDNCRGLDMKDSEATNTVNLIQQRQKRDSTYNYDSDGCGDFDTQYDYDTASYPTRTIHCEGRETETPIPTTELMQATRERTFYVEDDLDDDDEDIAEIPTSTTRTTKSHGTFIPPHTSSTCSLQSEPKALGTCRGSVWVAFFDTSSKDLRIYIRPEHVALSLVVLFLLAVLVVEAGERLWRFWNSELLVGQRIRLMGQEKPLLAVSDEDPSLGNESLEYRDYSSDYDREKQDVNES